MVSIHDSLEDFLANYVSVVNKDESIQLMHLILMQRQIEALYELTHTVNDGFRDIDISLKETNRLFGSMLDVDYAGSLAKLLYQLSTNLRTDLQKLAGVIDRMN